MSSEIGKRIVNRIHKSHNITAKQSAREAVDEELAETREHLAFMAGVMHRRAGTSFTIENCPVEDCQKSVQLLRQLDPKGANKNTI